MRSLIVIPTYNEADNILPLLSAILQFTPTTTDVLVVDDGSPDGTGAKVDALSKTESRITVLHRAKKMGLGTAYVAGFKWGIATQKYENFIEMDADFSHDPTYLSQMLLLLNQSDVVIGSRYVSGGGTRNWGIGRKILSRGGSLYSRLILGAPIRDFTGGFNGWKKKVLEAVSLDTLKSDGYSFQIELKYRAFRLGFRITEFPIIFSDRKVGHSKMNKRIVFEALKRVWSFRIKKFEALKTFALLALIVVSGAQAIAAPAGQSTSKGQKLGVKPTTALLVDKKTNTILVTQYVNGAYETIKTFHATLGQVKGDKEEEADLKTPEGIYTFNAKLRPPSLKPKFGDMAFYVNYPNTYDKLAGRTGHDIMLHATNEPDRLKQNYDSQGCIVVKNDEIAEISNYVKLGLTPFIIFSELTDEFKTPGKDQALVSFFESWISSWEKKDLNSYVDHYHSDFSAQGMNKAAWKVFKGNLNTKYNTIRIGPEAVHYYRHPKYSMITFTQNYRSTLRGGGAGHVSRGTKILYVAEESGSPKIIAETYTQLMW